MNTILDEYLPNPGDETNVKAGSDAVDGNAPFRLGEFDPLAVAGVGKPECDGAQKPETKCHEEKPHKPLIEIYSPSQLRDYLVPPNQNLVGDFHLQRGAPSVLAGPPGCGKSRATIWLGILGARGDGNWFGMQIHCRFKTLIIQSENGLARLHRDFEQIPNVGDLDAWLRVSAFPSYRSFEFSNPYFRNELKAALRDFEPQLVIVDPWNAVVRDSMERDFLEGFERLREIMAVVPDAACLILHHLRKPRSDDRHKGRSLAHLLSGSYVLASMARSVLVMQPASDDTEDVRVVLTPAKNNDGELGPRTAWERKTGWFDPVTNFNWEQFDSDGARREAKVKEEHLRELFEDGRRQMVVKQAADKLQEIADVGRSAAYEALKLDGGRFSSLLRKDHESGLIGLS